MNLHHLTLLGVGLIGGSIGLAVRRHFPHCIITGYSNDAASLAAARERHAIDKIAADPLEAVILADLVILCTPILVIPQLLPRIAPALPPQCIVTDVASTKASIVRWAGEFLGTPNRFVGSHPMAGSERQGVGAARGDLFDGAACLLTPTDQTDPAALRSVTAFWRSLQMRCVSLDPSVHDTLMAQVSHLPHAMAAALVNGADPAAVELAGKGFADTTRIAAGDAELWTGILLDNRHAVLSALERTRQELNGLHAMLQEQDAVSLKRWLQKAAERRAAMTPRQDSGS